MTLLARVPLLSCFCFAAARTSDEVSLLQHEVHLSAAARRRMTLANDTVYHLHIPKAAGISFGLDAQRTLAASKLKITSREGCYSWARGQERIRGTAVLLRDPRKHVLSQFDHCEVDFIRFYRDTVAPEGAATSPRKFEDWVRSWAELQAKGWHGDFTPPPEPFTTSNVELGWRSFRSEAWGEPPFSAERQTLDLQDWPRLDGGGTNWHCALLPFQCYAPISLQAQRLTCDMPLNYPVGGPNAELAVRNMQGMWFVGIVEAYQASVCLMQAKLGQALPSYCDCTKPELWETFPGTELNANDHKTSIEDFPEEILSMVDELTASDRLLYKAARVRFLREIAEVEREHGTRIVCAEEKKKLEA